MFEKPLRTCNAQLNLYSIRSSVKFTLWTHVVGKSNNTESHASAFSFNEIELFPFLYFNRILIFWFDAVAAVSYRFSFYFAIKNYICANWMWVLKLNAQHLTSSPTVHPKQHTLYILNTNVDKKMFRSLWNGSLWWW